MLIDLSELLPYQEGEREYPVSYGKEMLSAYEVSSAPEFVLKILHSRDNDFRVLAEGSLRVMIPCARCLEPVEQTILFTADRSFDLSSGLDTDGDECVFLTDKVLDTDELIADEALMNLPIRVLCRENCKGLCETCGANLNHGPCGCGEKETPTRMAEAIMAAINAAKNKK